MPVCFFGLSISVCQINWIDTNVLNYVPKVVYGNRDPLDINKDKLNYSQQMCLLHANRVGKSIT